MSWGNITGAGNADNLQIVVEKRGAWEKQSQRHRERTGKCRKRVMSHRQRKILIKTAIKRNRQPLYNVASSIFPQPNPWLGKGKTGISAEQVSEQEL